MRNAVNVLLMLVLGLGARDVFAMESRVPDLFLEEPREKLAEKGLSFDALYTGEMVSNLQGGLDQHTSYLGKLLVGVTADLGKAKLISGGSARVSMIETHGSRNPTEKYIRDLQTASNIEALDAVTLYELWYEQTLFQDHFSILVGAHDLNSEFAVTETGLLFLNSSFGIQPDISANVPVSIFPILGPAIRVKIKPNEEFEILAGIYDGDPTDGGKNRHGA